MRYVGGNFCDPVIEEDETIFSEEEILQSKIEKHLEEEENFHDEIIEADSRRVD